MSGTIRNRLSLGGKERLPCARNSASSELDGSRILAVGCSEGIGGRPVKNWPTPISICEISLNFDVVGDYPSNPPYGNTAMAKDKEALETFTATAAEIAEQTTKQTQEAMRNYFRWLQKAMSTFPVSNTNLNVILLSNALQNVTAAFAFVQKLSQAKNFEELVKIQTEFMEAQMNSFNEQAKTLSETYSKAAGDAMKTPFGERK
jgi:hypothetical protein